MNTKSELKGNIEKKLPEAIQFLGLTTYVTTFLRGGG